jgi:osmotically-inducible protein OsmY
MAQSAALLIPPTREPAGKSLDAVPATAALLTQSPEDLRLAERVEHALRATGYWPLRGIEVLVNARIVCLEGRVPRYYLKQMAQVTALAVSGTQQVRNNLEVVKLN